MCVSGMGGYLCVCVCLCFRSILFLYCAFERRGKHFLQVFTESNLRGVVSQLRLKVFLVVSCYLYFCTCRVGREWHLCRPVHITLVNK